MTETTTPPEPNPSPVNLLFTLIITRLAPMFLGVAMGNVALARAAAIETVNAYRVRHHADLITIAQIIGFGLAALASLSLSMDDTIAADTAIRFRGSANACNRSAEQNRRALAHAATQTEAAPGLETTSPYQDAWTPEPEHPDNGPDCYLSSEAAAFLQAESFARVQDPVRPAPIPPEDDWTEEAEPPPSAPDAFLSSEAAAVLEAESRARLQDSAFPERPRSPIPPQTAQQPNAPRPPVQRPPVQRSNAQQPNVQRPQAQKGDGPGAMWVGAMTHVAREIAADLPNLSGAERNQAKFQLSALTRVVNDLNRT